MPKASRPISAVRRPILPKPRIASVFPAELAKVAAIAVIEPVLAHGAIALADALGDGQHLRDRVLGDRLHVGVWREDDRQADLVGAFDVHGVNPMP